MNYFVEGLQGSGKTTLVGQLSENFPNYKAVREGEYSPVDLAWCAYLTREVYEEKLEKYPELREQIKEKTYFEDDRVIVCYTKVVTEDRSFYQDMEQYEIYNNRVSFDEFKKIVLTRFRNWSGDKYIFECSLFQNIVEDMMLFRVCADDEIVDFYKEVRKALEGKKYHIMYLKAEDIRGNLQVIRKERSDENGNEMWFPLMMNFFDNCPYSKAKGTSGEDDLIAHFAHRQELEIRILNEVFEGQFSVLLRGVKLVPVKKEDLETVWKMQIEAFSGLLAKYQDYDMSPGAEKLDKIEARFNQPWTTYYFIVAENKNVGVIRVVDKKDGSRKRISPIWIMEEFRGKGYAQRAIQEAEKIYGPDNWCLDTILQEEGNLHLYEKLGYRKTGKVEHINDRMDIVFYEKD